MNEIQSLQNFADVLDLKIVEKLTQDKRQTVKRYFAVKDGVSVSPVLNYEQLNHFLLGWNNRGKYTLFNQTKNK